MSGRLPLLLRSRLLFGSQFRCLRTSRSITTSLHESKDNIVNIVEVGPRDGLQNEKAIVPTDIKVELINRLAKGGLPIIESGSFVSPKWVPQMAGTAEILTKMHKYPGVRYPVLVPNQKGLDSLLELISASPTPPTNEIAIFTAATNEFTRANTNCTVAESLSRLSLVTRKALDSGLRVRGYVSVVITCPYSGKVDISKVRDVTKELLEMGCYEVSLGDTTGTGTPWSVQNMLEAVLTVAPPEKIAGHFHDTFGTGLSNALTSLQYGIRTLDSSIAGLGGCPYSPGATGNLATEDLLYVLHESGYRVRGTIAKAGNETGEVDISSLVETGFWISEKLGRDNASRAGKAWRAKMQRGSPQIANEA